MIGPLSVAIQQVMLTRAKMTLTTRVSRELAETLSMSATMAGTIADDLALQVSVKVLAEQLPAQRVTHRISEIHPEAIGEVGTVTDVRFARPIDHFTARYRGRWWGWWLGLRLRKIRYDDVPVWFRNTAAVHCDHEVIVEVADQWTYPKASPALSGAQGGPPVLVSQVQDPWSQPMINDPITLPW